MRAIKSFEELYKEVLRYGFDDGPQVNETRIKDWINEGQRQIAAEVDAPEFQETGTLTTTAGKKEVALPSKTLKVLSVRSKEQEWRLKPIDLQKYDSFGNWEAPAQYYALFKQEVWLFPIPAEVEKLEIRYLKEPPLLSLAGDTPVLDEANLYLLVRYALVRAFEAEDDYEAAKYHEGRYMRELKEYASQVQDRSEDRPKQLDGTWGGVY